MAEYKLHACFCFFFPPWYLFTLKLHHSCVFFIRKTGFLCCCDICCPVVPFNTSHLRVGFFFKLLWCFNTPPVHCNYHFWRNLSDRASRRRAKMIKWMVATFLISPLYFFIREIYTDILLKFIRIFFQICFIQNEGIHVSLYSLASMTGEYFVNHM